MNSGSPAISNRSRLRRWNRLWR